MTEFVYCSACGGDGWLPSLPEGRSECPYCQGTGRIEISKRIHKAEPGERPTHCRVCGQLIHSVIGGHGPTYVHTDSGAVAAPNPTSPKEGS